MRKILYFKNANREVPEAVLQECASYTPLLEPQDDGSVLADISGCAPAVKILRAIVEKNYLECGERLHIAMAGSRFLAQNALEINSLPEGRGHFYRAGSDRKTFFIEVFSGQEAHFTSFISLDEFIPLNPDERKRLKRVGFSTVGELAGLSLSRLVSLLGERAFVLKDYLQGRDNTPVLGIYPLDEISCPLVFDEENFNRISLVCQATDVSRHLQSALERKNRGCNLVRLEIWTINGVSKREKRLKEQGCRAQDIANAILMMLDNMEIEQIPEEGRVILAELSSLEWREQDLFSLKPCERENTEIITERVLERLQQRFPGQVMWGLEQDRREKILAYFDPWRYEQ